MTCGPGGQQGVVQARAAVGEHGQAFVQVVVRGGLADVIVDGKLTKAGAVTQPTQDQDGLPLTGQDAGAGAGAAATAFVVQQAGQERDGVLGQRQDGGVCDTHGAAEPF
jgi:hypothetical protein